MITHGSPDIKSHGKLRGFFHGYLAIELNLLSNNRSYSRIFTSYSRIILFYSWITLSLFPPAKKTYDSLIRNKYQKLRLD
jgi:hypothetical protein